MEHINTCSICNVCHPCNMYAIKRTNILFIFRVAIRVYPQHFYCFNARKLYGMELVSPKQLQMMGYTVIQVEKQAIRLKTILTEVLCRACYVKFILCTLSMCLPLLLYHLYFQVPYYEWNSMGLQSSASRIEFMEDKLGIS